MFLCQTLHPSLIAVQTFGQTFGAKFDVELLPMKSASGAYNLEGGNQVAIGIGQVLKVFDWYGDPLTGFHPDLQSVVCGNVANFVVVELPRVGHGSIDHCLGLSIEGRFPLVVCEFLRDCVFHVFSSRVPEVLFQAGSQPSRHAADRSA